MKNIANYISISRIIMSIMLLIPKTFSITFYIIYIYCGISDMLDGFIARKSKSENEMGAILDSIADITFVILAMLKILPMLNLSNVIIIWIIFIALIKIINAVYSYAKNKKIVLPHTIANKFAGFILFIVPLIIVYTNPIILEIIICSIATFAAVYEDYFIISKNNDLQTKYNRN